MLFLLVLVLVLVGVYFAFLRNSSSTPSISGVPKVTSTPAQVAQVLAATSAQPRITIKQGTGLVRYSDSVNDVAATFNAGQLVVLQKGHSVWNVVGAGKCYFRSTTVSSVAVQQAALVREYLPVGPSDISYSTPTATQITWKITSSAAVKPPQGTVVIDPVSHLLRSAVISSGVGTSVDVSFSYPAHLPTFKTPASACKGVSPLTPSKGIPHRKK